MKQFPFSKQLGSGLTECNEIEIGIMCSSIVIVWIYLTRLQHTNLHTETLHLNSYTNSRHISHPHACLNSHIRVVVDTGG